MAEHIEIDVDLDDRKRGALARSRAFRLLAARRGRTTYTSEFRAVMQETLAADDGETMIADVSYLVDALALIAVEAEKFGAAAVALVRTMGGADEDETLAAARIASAATFERIIEQVIDGVYDA